ncbi:MAG: FAD-binding protein, partial [Hyphomicrobium sp.]|nr:FAD-binding protein [Hyphomicrobium sp.]
MPASRSVSDAILDLSALLADRVATGEAVRAQHANTVSWRAAELPDAVVWPLTTEDVVGIVGVARRHRVPLIPFGAGTSLEGQVNAPLGGISVDFSRMTRILAVEPRDLD